MKMTQIPKRNWAELKRKENKITQQIKPKKLLPRVTVKSVALSL